MVESPPPAAARRSRRRGRRLTIGLLGAGVVLAGIGAAAWTWRVALVNRALLSKDSVWKVSVENLDLIGGRLQAGGLRVSHADQAEPVFAAARVSTTGGWEALQRGELGDVIVESPAVHWRGGMRSDPDKPDQASTGQPLVTWRSLKIAGGKVDLASPGGFSFTGTVSGEGGGGAWTEDSRLELAPQKLIITDAAYAMNLEQGPVASFEVAAGQLALDASLDAVTGTLNISRAAFDGSRVKLTGPVAPAPAVSPPGAPPATAAAAPESPDPDKFTPEPESGRSLVTGVRLAGLTAPAVTVGAALPWPLTGKADLALERLQAGTGVPFGMEKLSLARASAELPLGAGIPEFSLTGGLLDGVPKLESLTFSGAGVPDAAALLKLFGLELPVPAAVSFKADGKLSAITLREGKPVSSAPQTLTVSELKAELPGQGTATAERLTLTAVPDELLTDRRLRLVEVTAPHADVTLQSAMPVSPPVAAVLPGPEFPGTPAPAAVPGAPPPSAPRPVWEGWTADVLTVSGGTFAVTLPQAGGGRVTTELAVTTTPAAGNSGTAGTMDDQGNPAGTSSTALASPIYQITLGRPQLVHPELPEQPIALATAIQLTATAAGLWQRREIDSLTVSGSRLQIGEALFKLVNAMPAAAPAPPDAPAPPATSQVPEIKTKPWRLRQFELENTLIQLDHLGDGRRLDIPVKRQVFRDLPLDATALAGVNRLYKIEVPNITLYSPFSAGQKVAVLDTNYIQFTPSGLLERRLERVDLMLPSLYAGKHLFAFVEAARKRFEEMAAVSPGKGADKDAPLLVDNKIDSPAVLSALASVTPSTAAAVAEWHIPFYTESGKVFVAPKGTPWPNLPVIPFRNARDEKGNAVPFLLKGETFHGELAIEPGWYDFPEYKVRLKLSDRGRIVFNTPQKDTDNNLTEVFERNTLIFRQLRIDEAWLSITYDARGIYARFGGLTCGGTLAGGVNLYMDELYTWDAWASLIGIGMKPLTDKLTPDTFRMTGPVDELTVKAYGDTTTLYQASLDLKVTKPGQLNILALDGMKDKNEALGGLSADLGKISMATLRDFDYTTCSGNLKLFGTEGQGRLSLAGPGGSRTFNLRLHDYRATQPKTAAPF